MPYSDSRFLDFYNVPVKEDFLETVELQSILRNLDNRTQQMGSKVNELSREISNLYSQAQTCRTTAESLLNRSSFEDDANRSSDMVSQASAYMSRADYYESSAVQMESQLDGIKSDLRSCQSEYEYYINEGKTNLANLKIAAEKLTELSGAKYGGDKIKQTLEQTRHKMTFNNNLVEGCRRRISWIEQICGSSGGSPVKKYTLH